MYLTRRGLLAASAAALGAPAHAGEGPIRIGVLTDMSGPFSANTGMGSVAAARLAIDDFGPTVLGRPIELISSDHQNKPDVALATARNWFDREQVHVVADLVNSAIALAVMDLARDRDRLSFVVGSGSTAITNERCTATNVQWAYDSYATANTIARSLIAEGHDSWFFVTADYAFGQTTEQDATRIIQAAGGKVVGSVRHPPGNTDFASYLLAAQASGAKVVAFASAGADSVTAIKQASEFGIAAALVSLGLTITDVHGAGLPAAQGMYLCEGFYWDRTPATRAFSARFASSIGKVPNMAQAAMYSAVTHYLKAMRASGTDATGAVMARMRAMPVEDAVTHGGVVRPDGLMQHEMLLLRVKKPSESHGLFDYLTVIKAVPGDQAFAPLASSRCPLIRAG